MSAVSDQVSSPSKKLKRKKPSSSYSSPGGEKQPAEKSPPPPPSPDEKEKEGNKPSSDQRKSNFKRVFSDEDSAILLKAFNDILVEDETVSLSDATATNLIFGRIGKSLTLSVEINKVQLYEKIRKLRLKYFNQVEKKKTLNFKNPIDEEVFELSKKIWGENPTSNKKPILSVGEKKKKKKNKNNKEEEEPKNHPEDVEIETDKMIMVTAKVDLWKDYPYLMEEVSKFPENLVMKESIKFLDPSMLQRLNDQWRIQQVAEAEIFVKRTESIMEQTRLIIESSSPN